MGVALVASAAGGLARNTCKDRVTQAVAAAATIVIVMTQATWIFPLVIVLGASDAVAHMIPSQADEARLIVKAGDFRTMSRRISVLGFG